MKAAERALRPDTTLDSPATRGKLPSPERGGQTKNLSVHPSGKRDSSRDTRPLAGAADTVGIGIVRFACGRHIRSRSRITYPLGSLVTSWRDSIPGITRG